MSTQFPKALSPLPCARRMLIAAAMIWLIGSGLVPALAQSPPKIQSGVSVPVRSWVRAVENGDEQAIARMNSDNALAYVPDAMVLKGRAAIAAAYRGMFGKFSAKVSIDDAYYIEGDNVIHSWGLYTLTLTPKTGGNTVVMSGRFSDIAVRADDGWQYVMDHASLPLQSR